jgi:hypothetical protein
MSPFFQRPVCSAYLDAKAVVMAAGYVSEIDWQERAAKLPVSEDRLLREFAWVVLNAGMREKTIRKLFGPISEIFGQWQSAAHVWRNRNRIRYQAATLFNSPQKIEAIIVFAGYLRLVGAHRLWARVSALDGPQFLTKLPYMGPATSRHFVKNLGASIAKPDRHLHRIASKIGVSVSTLCESISALVGDPVEVVDIVLWRFAVITRRADSAFLASCMQYVGPQRATARQ